MRDMSDILEMVRSGRLAEATDSIQRRLSPGGEPVADEPGPMKDVTPQARAIPSPNRPTKAARKPKAKAEGVKRKAGELWSRVKGGIATPPPLRDGAKWEQRTGAVPYRLFVPSAPADDAPLIMMLHGCTQTPEDFATGTKMVAAAEGIGAHVIWPEQGRGANANLCWNWFETGHQGRTGEAAALASVVETVRAEIGGGRKVHVAGLSAGGAMAAILGAHYPDLVASVGVHSGLPVGSARDVASAFAAMGSGGAAGVPLKVPAIVFHGDADRTVAPANGTALLPGTTPARKEVMGGRAVRVATVTPPGQGTPSELWQVAGLGHAWSGGDKAGSHADPHGPDATAEMIRFFKAVG